MSTVESQPAPQSGSLRWSLPDASWFFGGGGGGGELPTRREDERGAEENFHRWVEAIWSLSEDNFIYRPLEMKLWYDFRGMANHEVRTHLDFVTRLFEESIKVYRLSPSAARRSSFLPTVYNIMKADIREHILRNERRMELEATEEEKERHRTTRLKTV